MQDPCERFWLAFSPLISYNSLGVLDNPARADADKASAGFGLPIHASLRLRKGGREEDLVEVTCVGFLARGVEYRGRQAFKRDEG